MDFSSFFKSGPICHFRRNIQAQEVSQNINTNTLQICKCVLAAGHNEKPVR